MRGFYEGDGIPRALPDDTLPYYFPNIKTGRGFSANKARPKRKPRPKKSARGSKK